MENHKPPSIPPSQRRSSSRRRLFGIRGRLLLLVLAAMAPLVILGLLNIREQLMASRALQFERARGQAQVVATMVDSQLRAIDTLLTGLSLGISTDPADQDKNKTLFHAEMGRLPLYFKNLKAVTMAGRPLGAAVGEATLTESERKLLSGSAWNRLAIEPVPVALPNGNRALLFARSIPGTTEQAAGVVIATVELEWPGALFDAAGLPGEMMMTIVNERRIVVGRSQDAHEWIGRDISGVGAGDFQTTGTAITNGSAAAKPVLVGQAAATLAPWRVFVEVPMTSTYASLQHEFGSTVLIGLGAIAAALGLAWLIAGRITKPILQLAADARMFSTGDTRHRSRVRSNTEVGSLARTFNRMLDALHRRDAALRSNESRYRTLIDNAPEAIVVLDVDQGRFVDHNPAAEQLFKLDHDGLRQVGVLALSPAFQPDGRSSVEAMKHHLQQVLDGDTPAFEWLHHDSTGREIPCEVRLLRLPNERRLLVRGSLTAISERKQAEQRLAQTLSLQRAILDHAGYAIISTTPGGIITTFNPAAERLLGYTAQEVIGQHAAQLIHDPEEVAASTRALSSELGRMIAPGFEVFMARARATARSEQEWTYVRKDGSRVPVQVAVTALTDPAGQTTGFVGMAVDITERHRAEQQLAHERTVLELIARGTSQNVVLTMLIKGHETLFPATLGSVLLLDEDGQSFVQSVAPSLPADYNAKFEGAKLGPASFNGSRRATAFTGKKVIVTDIATDSRWENFREDALQQGLLACWSVPIRSGQGKVLGVFAVYYREAREPQAHELAAIAGSAQLAGLTIERRHAEVARDELERKLLETQKLESLGVLAGGIAHDFNNLLTGILGNADLAAAELAVESPVQEYLKQINQSSLRAADLCRQMLAYSGRGRFVVQQLDLNLLVTETIQLLQLSISKKAELRFNLTPDLPGIEADATQVRQVIMNLVINASEALGDRSGSIEIRTRAVTVGEDYFSGASTAPERPQGRYVLLEIIDDGCGMTAETQAKIFDPFFSTKFTGRGLGLAAVLGIMRGHNSALKVKSEVGRGTTFELFFPCAPGSADSLEAPATVQTAWQGRGTVLVVDDEEAIRKMTSAMLNSLGFETTMAADGRDAVAVLRENPARFSLVILDLTMPHMDGEQAFTEMRLLKPDIRVILMSGFNRQESVAKFTGRGLASFLQKPFDLAGLKNVLQSVLDDPHA